MSRIIIAARNRVSRNILFDKNHNPRFLFNILAKFPFFFLPKLYRKKKLLKEGEIQLYFSRERRLHYYIHSLDFRFKQLLKEYCITVSILKEISKEDLILDIGANIGEFSLAMHHVGGFNNFICYEPELLEFEALGKNVSQLNSTIKNLGVSNKVGLTKLVSANDTGDSYILESVDPLLETTEINTTTLDLELSEIEFVGLMKLEAEGHEPEILKGGLNVLKKIKFITIDGGYERNGNSTFHDCLYYLLDNNFELIDFSHIRHTILLKNKLL